MAEFSDYDEELFQLQHQKHMQYKVHDIIRYHTSTGIRVWQITGIVLGSLGHENHYQMRPLDLKEGNNVEGKLSECLVPVQILDSHENISTAFSAPQ